jgi:hypothetical protein
MGLINGRENYVRLDIFIIMFACGLLQFGFLLFDSLGFSALIFSSAISRTLIPRVIPYLGDG